MSQDAAGDGCRYCDAKILPEDVMIRIEMRNKTGGEGTRNRRG